VVLGGEKTERKNTRERWRGWRSEDGRRGARVSERNQRGLEDKEEREQVVVGVAMRGFTPLA
jgi:hypothetical protein